MPDLPITPDYDAWPIDVALEAVSFSPRLLTVHWQDGRVSRYHSIWLRENAADDTTINPATRERILDLSSLPAWPEIAGAEIDAAGALCVTFAPEDRRLRFHQGWLRANDYDQPHDKAADPEAPLVPVTTCVTTRVPSPPSWVGWTANGANTPEPGGPILPYHPRVQAPL